MNAYEIPNLRFSLPAGGAVERARFVSVDADSNGIQATASTPVIGASMNRVTAKETEAGVRIVEIADGIVMVEAADAVEAGTAVYSDAEGKVAASGTVIAGIAITSAAAAGDLVAVKI